MGIRMMISLIVVLVCVAAFASLIWPRRPFHIRTSAESALQSGIQRLTQAIMATSEEGRDGLSAAAYSLEVNRQSLSGAAVNVGNELLLQVLRNRGRVPDDAQFDDTDEDGLDELVDPWATPYVVVYRAWPVTASGRAGAYRNSHLEVHDPALMNADHWILQVSSWGPDRTPGTLDDQTVIK